MTVSAREDDADDRSRGDRTRRRDTTSRFTAAAFRHRSFPLNGRCSYARQMPPITSPANSFTTAPGPRPSMRSPRSSASQVGDSASCAIGTIFRFPLGDGGPKRRPGIENDKHLCRRRPRGMVTSVRFTVGRHHGPGYCERFIGTARRECLDWMIPLHERHLRRVLAEWIPHYDGEGPHSPWVRDCRITVWADAADRPQPGTCVPHRCQCPARRPTPPLPPGNRRRVSSCGVQPIDTAPLMIEI